MKMPKREGSKLRDKMKKLILMFLALFVWVSAQASVVRTHHDNNGWQLLVDSQPYFIRSMPYHTDKVGQDPNLGTYQDWMVMDENTNGLIDGPYESWVDGNRNNIQDASEPVVGDFKLMQQMGVNTIRIYHHPSDDPLMTACYTPGTGGDLIWNHAPNKALLRDMFNTYGIRFIMGDEFGAYTTSSCAPWEPGTDYTDPVQIASMTYSVRKMVADFKDEPGLLMYVLGNENNYSFTHTNAFDHLQEYYTFVGQMVDLIHSLDPYHPVGIADGEVANMAYVKQYAPNLDIYGANVYRNEGAFTGFGVLWQQVADTLGKPFMLTEYGSVVPKILPSGLIDEDYQAAILQDYLCDIEAHAYGKTSPRNSIGGTQYTWLDNWWQAGSPNSLSTTSPNSEQTGIAGQGSGMHSPFQRVLKDAYYMNLCNQCP